MPMSKQKLRPMPKPEPVWLNCQKLVQRGRKLKRNMTMQSWLQNWRKLESLKQRIPPRKLKLNPTAEAPEFESLLGSFENKEEPISKRYPSQPKWWTLNVKPEG